MAYITVTNTFTNSTTADATQVNTNFTDLINGTSDGTKDFNINLFTCAGAATMNGNVTVGDASSDTLTVTASLGSSIPIKTTFSYDIGSATLGLKSVYLGSNDSAARSVRLIAGAVGTSYTLTLPTAVPAQAKYVLESDTSGTTSFTSRTLWQLSTKTAATYTITAADDTIIADATSNSITITLPSPSATGISGKTFRIKRIDATYTPANLVTIARAGTEKIDGTAANVVCMAQGEGYTLQSNGTDWYVLDHPSASSLYGSIKYAATANCTWNNTASSSTLSNFAANTNCATPTVTGAATAPATKIPGIVFANLPAGDYLFVVMGRIGADRSASGSINLTISDGTNTGPLTGLLTTSGYQVMVPSFHSRLRYSTTQTNITFQVQASETGTQGAQIDANTATNSIDFQIDVYRFPL